MAGCVCGREVLQNIFRVKACALYSFGVLERNLRSFQTFSCDCILMPDLCVGVVDGTFQTTVGFPGSDFCQKAIKMILRCILSVFFHL